MDRTLWSQLLASAKETCERAVELGLRTEGSPQRALGHKDWGLKVPGALCPPPISAALHQAAFPPAAGRPFLGEGKQLPAAEDPNYIKDICPFVYLHLDKSPGGL